MTVAAKLVAIVLFVALVPLGVSAITALGTYESELGREVKEGHRRTADYGARSTTASLEAVQRTIQGLAGTIPWASLTPAERHGALLLVYEQAHDIALVALHDGAHANLGSIHATAASNHPTLPTEVATELAKGGASGRSGWSIEAPIALALDRPPLVPMVLDVAGPGGARWTLTVALSLGGICEALATASPPSVATRLEGPNGERLCGPPPLAGAMQARAATGARWHVVAEQSRDVALASVRRLRRQTLYWIGVTALAAITAGIVLTQAIRKPIRKLVVAAEKVGRGNLGYRVDLTSHDELGALGRAFDRMAADLGTSEAEIRAWNAELQTRVDARTAELKAAQEQLLQSRKLGAIATLGAGIAHEINNPLMGVLGLTQVLLAKRDQLESRVATKLATIEREALRIRAIVENVQGLAQDTMRDAIRIAPTSIVNAVANSRAQQLEAARVEVVRSFSDDVPAVMGNAGQLEHAIAHLVDNSIKAMAPSGGTLRLGVRSIEGELVAIDVEDSGRGIAPELLDKIFEPFFTTKDDWRGLGLGLALAHRIVEVHNGRIAAASKLGSGTTMTVILPAARRGAHIA